MQFNALSFGERLKIERERLGLSQLEAAESCGVRREMWGKYERGDSEPGTRVLERFSTHNADVLYILTGRREPKLETNEGFINPASIALDAVELFKRFTLEGVTENDYFLDIEGEDADRLKQSAKSCFIGRLVSLAGEIYNRRLSVPWGERKAMTEQWARGVAFSEYLRIRDERKKSTE